MSLQILFLSIRCLEIALGYMWLEMGLQGAGNVLALWVWSMFAAGVMLAFAPVQSQAGDVRALRSNWIYVLCAVAILAWCGHTVIALAYLAGRFMWSVQVFRIFGGEGKHGKTRAT